ncbi:MAG: helix-turn-helix domain-containing protein [Trueperaceae bacterium]
MPEGRCYSFGDICKLYRVSPKVVSRWIRQGKLKASQAGPHMRTYILPEDLHDFEVRMELWTDPNPHQYLDDAPEQKSLAE